LSEPLLDARDELIESLVRHRPAVMSGRAETFFNR
jgi:hypothetical protein